MDDRARVFSHQELRIHPVRRELVFRRPARTSRNVLVSRPVWYLRISHPGFPGLEGVGECAPIEGLSPETGAQLEEQIARLTADPALLGEPGWQPRFPSLAMAIEMAMSGLRNGMPWQLAAKEPVDVSIPINGLVWMEEAQSMIDQAFRLLEAGFTCIKLKVGALAIRDELRVLEAIRTHPEGRNALIRLDANGAFHPDDAAGRLKELAAFAIHSIEQPVRPGQRDRLGELCMEGAIAVALDEELIGITDPGAQRQLLESVRPQYLVLKPTLHGGWSGTLRWIGMAESLGIGWWVTSALESNIGLNAIAQWLSELKPSLPQGLGTGALFRSNAPPLWEVRGGYLHYTGPPAPGAWDKWLEEA